MAVEEEATVSSSDDESEVDADDDEAPGRLKASHIQQHRKELDEAKKRLESAKEGDWTVFVHVIECCELVATDADGSADPVVVVEVNFGDGKKKKAVTRVIKNDRSAVFDEVFKFEWIGLNQSDIEMGSVTVTVIDADISVAGHGVGDLIGVWNADILDSIYSLPHHELYRQFVCLVNNEATNADESGTQGFIKLSVAAIGPGEKKKQRNVEKDKALERKRSAGVDGNALAPMMSPLQPVELRFLVVKIHNVENLCAPAASCFVKVELGTGSMKTVPRQTFPMPHYHQNFMCRYCEINQALWMAVLYPTMTQTIRVTIWEKRKGKLASTSSSTLIGTTRLLKLSRVRAYPAKFKQTQLVFYGESSSVR